MTSFSATWVVTSNEPNPSIETRKRDMVCSRCEKKLSTLITPDAWKDGSRNAHTGKAGRRVGVNMMATKVGKNRRYTPMSKICRICKDQVHQWANYCSTCAFQKGICARCGRKVSGDKYHNTHESRRSRDEGKKSKDMKEEETREERGKHPTREPFVTIKTTPTVDQKVERVPETSNQESDEWVNTTDERGNTFYFNSRTGESQWEKPTSKSEERLWRTAKDKSGRVYYYHTVTNETRWDDPLEKKVKWKKATDKAGRDYYYNVLTNETRWDCPTQEINK